MKVSEDPHSWKAGGILRRDFRASKSEPETSKPKRGTKKDLKRFCHGNPKLPHLFELKPMFPPHSLGSGITWISKMKIWICQRKGCGKKNFSKPS